MLQAHSVFVISRWLIWLPQAALSTVKTYSGNIKRTVICGRVSIADQWYRQQAILGNDMKSMFGYKPYQP